MLSVNLRGLGDVNIYASLFELLRPFLESAPNRRLQQSISAHDLTVLTFLLVPLLLCVKHLMEQDPCERITLAAGRAKQLVGHTRAAIRSITNGGEFRHLDDDTSVVLKTLSQGHLDADVPLQFTVKIMKTLTRLWHLKPDHVSTTLHSGIECMARESSLAKDNKNLSSAFHMFGMLTTLLHHPEPAVSSAVVECLPCFSIAFPSLSLDLLPVAIQFINSAPAGDDTQEQRSTSMQLLQTLPELAARPICVQPLLKCVSSLMKVPDLQPMGLRMLCQLTLKQPRLFFRLQKALETVPEKVALSLRLAQIACVHDICVHQTHQANVLVEILQLRLADTCPAVVSFAIRAMDALCKGKVIDFHLAFRTVSDTVAIPLAPRSIEVFLLTHAFFA